MSPKKRWDNFVLFFAAKKLLSLFEIPICGAITTSLDPVVIYGRPEARRARNATPIATDKMLNPKNRISSTAIENRYLKK
jgi:hypothetical protein